MSLPNIFIVPDAVATRPVDEPGPSVRPSIFQVDAARFATTQEDYAAAERNAGVRESNRLRVAGEPGRAWMVFFRSYKRQLRILGLGYAAIPGHEYLDDGPGVWS